MRRRGFLRAALASAAGAALFGAGWPTVRPAVAEAVREWRRPPSATAGTLVHTPVFERYGWVDAYGLETIGYRKTWPGVRYENGA